MAADMRAWLAAQGGPRTVTEIAAGLPQYDAGTLARTAHRMWRDGMFTRSGKCRSYAFGLGRAPIVKAPSTSTERARRRRGGGTWADYLARCAERTAATKARLEAEKAARREAAAKERAERQAARQAAQEARRAAPKPPRPKAPPKPGPVRERVHVAPAPAPVVFESVEAFMARGGKVQKLDPGACSKPLKRIGAFTITRRKAA
jgi:hypothetical protein